MKAKSQALQTLSVRQIGLAVLALALALSLWLVVAAPQAQAATVKLDGTRTTLTTDPGTTTALFSAGIIPLPVMLIVKLVRPRDFQPLVLVRCARSKPPE